MYYSRVQQLIGHYESISTGRSTKTKNRPFKPAFTTSTPRTSGSALKSPIESPKENPISNLQRYKGLSRLPQFSGRSASSPSSASGSETTPAGPPISRAAPSRVPQRKRIRKGPTIVKKPCEREEGKKSPHLAPAFVAILDHATSRLDGLSDSKRSPKKEHLQKLVRAEDVKNDLSSRLSDLESLLRLSRDVTEHDVEEATSRYETAVEEIKRNLKVKEDTFRDRVQEITQRLSQQESDHHQTVEKLLHENQMKIEDIEVKHKEFLAQLRHEWSEERAEIEKETLELRATMDAKVQEKLEDLIQPYITSYEENKSLRTVLEMKNKENQNLQHQISGKDDNLEKMRALSNQVITLKQKNEDLQAQVDEKNIEQRETKKELEKIQQILEEQNRVRNNQQQRIEELSYRISINSPSPVSSFNPVFTQSPVSTDGDIDSDWSFTHNPTRSNRRQNADDKNSTQRNGFENGLGNSYHSIGNVV